MLRLIDMLCQAGAVHIRRPACPRCGRVITLVRPRDGIRLCRNCLAKSKAEPCSRCGAVREPAARDEHHLFDDDLDAVGVALDHAATSSSVGFLWVKPTKARDA